MAESLGDTFRAVFLEVLSIWTSKPRRIKAASTPTERLQVPSPYLETLPFPLQALTIASMNPFRLSAKMRKRMPRQGTAPRLGFEQASPSTGKSRRLSLVSGFAPT